MPDEDKVMDTLRPLDIPPGDYMVPRPSSREDMRSPDFLDKLRNGPVMIFTVFPNGQTSMGMSLTLWFFYIVVVGFFTAYLAARTLPVDADFLHIFRLTGVTSFMGYCAALWQMSIWYRRAWSTTIKATGDGFIYALLTAVTFAWLWPHQ